LPDSREEKTGESITGEEFGNFAAVHCFEGRRGEKEPSPKEKKIKEDFCGGEEEEIEKGTSESSLAAKTGLGFLQDRLQGGRSLQGEKKKGGEGSR